MACDEIGERRNFIQEILLIDLISEKVLSLEIVESIKKGSSTVIFNVQTAKNITTRLFWLIIFSPEHQRETSQKLGNLIQSSTYIRLEWHLRRTGR